MDIASMEPLVPEEGVRALEDEVVPLIAEANQLAGRIRPSYATRLARSFVR